jgi:hypothetical protein
VQRARVDDPRETPAIEHDARVVRRGFRDAEAGARDALVVFEPPDLRVRERGMREEQLARREAAGVGIVASRERKNVTWKPSSSPSAVFSQPVTYHHSVRKSGCAPWSRGKAKRCSIVASGKTGVAAIARDATSNANIKRSRFLTSPPARP